MNYLEQIRRLNAILLDEMPSYKHQTQTIPPDLNSQRRLLRSLMNLRPPIPINREFLTLQDELLRSETAHKGIIDAKTLPTVTSHPQISLWQGDITRLRADAIVNAANSGLTGCYIPCHNCIDNAIHTASGLQLRDECAQIMQNQGYPEPNGRAKLTKGYNLPSKYVLHTVGPIIRNRVTNQDRADLTSCYRSCLDLAAAHGLQSVAFCCISTGEFHFPNEEAAEIAVSTVTDFLKAETSINKVIFNVFKDTDEQIYRTLLGADSATETGI